MTNRIQSDPRGDVCLTHWLATIKRRLSVVLLLLVLLQAAALAGPLVLHGRIVRVTDGDTVTLLDEYQAQHKIRLAGIDAPESGMPYGQEATALLASLVLGQSVVAHARKQDRYGRSVATVTLNAQDVSLAMIQAGLAWHYRQYAAEQPKGEARAYAQAEERARTDGLGLWQDGDPVAPWDWRRKRRSDSTGRSAAVVARHVRARVVASQVDIFR